MFQVSLLGDSETYSGTFPPSGTMLDGIVSARSTLGLPIFATDSGYAPSDDDLLFPTPSAVDYGTSGNGAGGNSERSRARPSLATSARTGRWPTMHGAGDDGRGNELSQAVRVEEGVIDAERDGNGHWRRTYPTPKASDGDGRGGQASRYPARGNLVDAVMVPSPRVGSGGAAGGSDLRDFVNGERPRNWPTPKASPSGPDFARAGRPESGGDDLATAVVRPVGPIVESWAEGSLWPTPRASEWKGTGPIGSKSQAHRLDRHYLDATVQEVEQETGPLNPDRVEWLMGFPIGWTDLSVDEPVVLEGEPWPPDPSPRIPRMAKGVARRKQRLMQLGNAVVPKIPEILGLELRELLATVEEEV